jgi:dTDP-4-dehydrorhamnose 3,5-epimerase
MFVSLGYSDARLIELAVNVDDRGNFTPTWCAATFAREGIDFTPIQGNTSLTLLYIPAGFAHGFQTLADDTIVEYLMGVGYEAELSDEFRHDDPLIGIKRPGPVSVLSAKDAAWSRLSERKLW